MTERRLFIGVYSTGLSYADRQVQENGDYRRLCFLPYATLQPSYAQRIPPALRAEIEKDVASMQSKLGQAFEIASSGQTITLGGSRGH